ncbi:MAG: lamin tail domain-containing protein [Saprospiraceae bacterium]|nr:lamin tail domain-containing protein [Saprospiraceae bacterium]
MKLQNTLSAALVAFFTLFAFGKMAAQSNVVINEVMASNVAYITDENGEYEDWIELYNNSGSSVNLGGWFLSDNPDNLDKWEFPPILLSRRWAIHHLGRRGQQPRAAPCQFQTERNGRRTLAHQRQRLHRRISPWAAAGRQRLCPLPKRHRPFHHQTPHLQGQQRYGHLGGRGGRAGGFVDHFPQPRQR